MGLEIRETTSHNQIRNLPGENDLQKYRNAKSDACRWGEEDIKV